MSSHKLRAFELDKMDSSALCETLGEPCARGGPCVQASPLIVMLQKAHRLLSSVVPEVMFLETM